MTESLVLDRRFRHIGRIKKASGTTHPPTFRRVNEMLTGLFERGRLDLLRSIKDGTLTPMQVYDAYRLNELHKLPTAQLMAPLKETMEAWIKTYDCSEKHRLSLSQSLRYLVRKGRVDSTVGDLPALVAACRVDMQGKHHRTFNLLRSAAQAFVRSTMKKTHPLWLEIAGVEPLKEKRKTKRRPLTVEEMHSEISKLSAGHQRNAWGMALTGMGPGEYWGKWCAKPDRIHIAGTKREGRVRDVPLIQPVPVPYATPKAFALALQHGLSIRVTPYDFRRTYANWLESAGIIKTRRRLYMGHETRDVTDLYELHEVAAFLKEDAEKIRRFIGATDEPTLKLVNKS